MSRNFAKLQKHDRERARDERKAAKLDRLAERKAAKVSASYAAQESDEDPTTGATGEAR